VKRLCGELNMRRSHSRHRPRAIWRGQHHDGASAFNVRSIWSLECKGSGNLVRCNCVPGHGRADWPS
jgi:hypothetical protein